MNHAIYLGGPMYDCSESEATIWRDYATLRLRDRGYEIKNPTLFVPEFQHIVQKDKDDIRNSSVILSYIRKDKPSVGTHMEIHYAYEMVGIPVVLWGDIELMSRSPWLRYHSDKRYETLHEALDWLIGAGWEQLQTLVGARK